MTDTTFNDRLCSALVTAKNRAPEIVALLHSAFHDGCYLPSGYVAQRLAEARTDAEKILVAILAAEQSVAPQAPPAKAVSTQIDEDRASAPDNRADARRAVA